MPTKKKHKCASSNPKLIYDQACLDIYNERNCAVIISGRRDECDGCKFVTVARLQPRSNTSVVINTKYYVTLNYTYIGNYNTCRFNKLVFHEHYRYGWNLTEQCNPIYIKKSANNAYLPILTAFLVLFTFGILWYLVKCINKWTKNTETRRSRFACSSKPENDLGNLEGSTSLDIETPTPICKHSHRLKSLDVFRGLCLILMIFVNYDGGQYWFFMHSIWNGLTIADLVFPWFLWVMGFSLTISVSNKLHKAVPRRQLFIQIVRRSVILVLLGIVVKSHGKMRPLYSIRFPGILQRIGVTYLIVGLLEVAFTKEAMIDNKHHCLAFLQDIVVAIPQWIIVLAMVFVHTTITFLLQVPGCGRGYLGPGGEHNLGQFRNCTGGAAGYIDRVVFGGHMFTKPFMAIKVYGKKCGNYDHDGILGTLTAVLAVYLGVQAGRIFHMYGDVRKRLIRWITWGIITALIGGILCGFTKNHGVIPINRYLWSLSFVLIADGLAFAVHSILTVIIDVLHIWEGRPVFYLGMNSIFLYVGHELFKYSFPFSWIPVDKTHAAYLTIHLWGTDLWVVIAIFLYKRKIFLSI